MLSSVSTGRTGPRLAWKVLNGGACCFFLGFALLRAVRVPLTYDEAATYLKYVSKDALAPFNFAYATNHFLNTLLAKALSTVAGPSDLVLRVPSLLGYVMYLRFSLQILRRLVHRAIACGGFLLLNLNPYVLDYFALSRGYGLSLGFLMGALFYLFRFLAAADGRAGDARFLSRALMFAGGAVMANFAMLNLYVSVLAVGLMAFVAVNATGISPSAGTAVRPRDGAKGLGGRTSSRRARPWLPLVAAAFALLVFSQDVGLSARLYEPVTIELVGVDEPVLGAVRVVGIDIRGQETTFTRVARVWRQPARAHLTGLRIECPASAADGLTAVEIVAGRHTLWDERARRLWQARDEGATRILESTRELSLPRSRMPAFRQIINWGGDRRLVGILAASTALAVLLLGALALVLEGIGWLVQWVGLVRREQWQTVASGVLWIVALAGSPLYLLKRDGELYFGGTDGFLQDTVASLISNSFYGRVYGSNQTTVVLGGIGVTAAVFAVILIVQYRRGRLRPLLPGACLLALMALVALVTVGQHLALHTPYLTGRTALFYIPLYVLFAAFLCDAVADLGPTGAVVATSLMAFGVAAAIYHFSATANLLATWDWPRDAGTKAMMADLERLVTDEGLDAGVHPVLGVYWGFWPVADVYALRSRTAQIDVVAEPSPRAADFLYLEDGQQAADMPVLKTYPVADSVLVRTH